MIGPKNENISGSQTSVSPSTDPATEAETDNVNLFTLYKALRNQGLEKGEEVFNKLQSQTPSVADQEFNTIFFASNAYQFGLKSNFQEIEKVLNETAVPINKVRALQHIADIHIGNTHFDKAIELGLRVLNLAGDIPSDEGKQVKVIVLFRLNDAYLNLRRQKEYIGLLLNHVNTELTPEQKSSLYKKVADVYKELNQPLEEAVFLIKAIDCAGNNTSLLFDVAYAFSNLNNSELALHYYRLSNGIKRDQAYVLNNMGVALDLLGMHAEAGSRFTQAYLSGNSLAGANIANKYINIGMFEAASKILDDSKANATDVHQNVYKAYETMEKTLNEEKEKSKVIASDGLEMSVFFRKYADAVAQDNGESYSFSLDNVVSADISQVASGTDADKSITITTGTHSMRIHLQREYSNFGVCEGVLNKSTNQYLSDTFKGHFVFNETGLHVALSHIYIHTRRDCRFYHIKPNVMNAENLLITA